MNHVCNHPLTIRNPSLLRHVLIESSSPSAVITPSDYPCSCLPIVSSPESYFDLSDFNPGVAEGTIDSTILELPNDVDDTSMAFQEAMLSSPVCQPYLENMNNFPRRLSASPCQLNLQASPRDTINQSAFDISLRRLSYSPGFPQNMQVLTNRHSFSINNNSDYAHLVKRHDKQRSRSIYSTTSSPSHHNRLPFLQNVRYKDIKFGPVVGKGGFGKVYTGYIQGQAVAIKVVKKRRGSGIHREIVQAERLAFSLNLRHENIVSILGVNLCDGLQGDALIVMELASPQTLQVVLDDHAKTITLSQRIIFALQITKALEYLHHNEVAHLDVKPRNVLLTTDNTCKLADFGSLTRTRKDSPREETEFTQLLGTLPYRAPELMKGCFPSSKADIYSLGITLWQLVTREVPYSGANPHWLIYQVTKVNKRPDHHDTGSDTVEVKYRDLYTACWEAEPDMRPSAGDAILDLTSLLQCVWDNSWSGNFKRRE